ncbi:MAG TPA: ORF6N domain-containing protein [Verrucomicrobiae bacterium]|nr:ORF6N domain-containing protein [Verrucomicrobiae bacterium]
MRSAKTAKATELVAIEPVDALIRIVRGQRVILDADLARVYGVPTKRLNEAVKRNGSRFPEDFAFQLTRQEVMNLRSQFATSKGRGGLRYLPYAFTEHGAIMAANVLSSDRAVAMSVFVVRAFVKLRATIAGHRELADKLAELERRLTERLDDHEQAIRHVLGELRKLMSVPPDPPRKQIGFHVKERRGMYRLGMRRK